MTCSGPWSEFQTRPVKRRRAANGFESILNSSVPRRTRTNYGVDGTARDQSATAAEVLVTASSYGVHPPEIVSYRGRFFRTLKRLWFRYFQAARCPAAGQQRVYNTKPNGNADRALAERPGTNTKGATYKVVVPSHSMISFPEFQP